jgi:thiol:disulfide interchange protein DsbC
MLRGTLPVSDGKCDVPIDKNKQLAQRFRINGTPAIFLADGRMIGGYIPAEELEQALNSATPK